MTTAQIVSDLIALGIHTCENDPIVQLVAMDIPLEIMEAEFPWTDFACARPLNDIARMQMKYQNFDPAKYGTLDAKNGWLQMRMATWNILNQNANPQDFFGWRRRGSLVTFNQHLINEDLPEIYYTVWDWIPEGMVLGYVARCDTNGKVGDMNLPCAAVLLLAYGGKDNG